MSNADQEMNGVEVDMKAVLGEVWRRRYRIALVTLALCAAAYVFLMFVPRVYEASASLLVEPRSNVFLRAANDTGNGNNGIADGVLMSSQVQLIQSSETLLQVVRSENLVDVPEFNGSSPSLFDPIFALLGRKVDERNLEQKVLARLTKNVTVIQQRDSRVISILVRSESPALAAQIANSLASTHVNRRAELSLTDTVDAAQWLEPEIEKLRVRVVDAESAAAAFRIDNDLFVGANNISLVDQQLSSIATQISASQERGNAARSRATLIEGLLNSGQSIDGLADVQNSLVIQRLSENKAQLQAQRAQLLATLLANHPQVLAVSAQIEEIDKQILVEGRRVAEGLKAEAEIEGALSISLQDDLTRLKVTASSATTSTVKLQELEREAKALRDLLETYLARYRDASARTDTGAALPDVRVISFALPPLRSSSPKTTLILIAIAIVSMAVQTGTILFGELAAVVPVVRKGTTVEREVPLDLRDSGIAPDPDLVTSPTGEVRGALPSDLRDDLPDEGGAQEMPEMPKMPEMSEVTLATVIPANAEARPGLVGPGEDDKSLDELVGALTSGREKAVILSALDEGADCSAVGAQLLERLMGNGMRVAVVDAASGQVSTKPGISDLSAQKVTFGDVVFTSGSGDLTEVFWGRLPKITQRSDRPGTLIEALSDICEAVVVFAEPVGANSSLPVFSGIEAVLVLVANQNIDMREAGVILKEAAALGFEKTRVLITPKSSVNVA